jgi:hypothetical protein
MHKTFSNNEAPLSVILYIEPAVLHMVDSAALPSIQGLGRTVLATFTAGVAGMHTYPRYVDP